MNQSLSQLRKPVQRPAALFVAGAGKQTYQRRARIGFVLAQQTIDFSIVVSFRRQPGHSISAFNSQRLQYIQITIDLMPSAIRRFKRRLWSKVRQEIDRSSTPSRKQALRCARKKAEQVCFRKTVQVDNEIELALTHVFHDAKNSEH